MNQIARVPQRVRHQARLRTLPVLRVEDLSPRLRRIVLGGPALDGFTSAAFDDHVKLFLPAPGTDGPILPRMGPEGPVYPEGAVRPTLRDYTPRRHDPAAQELTVDFVLHAHGPASDWARQAAQGQLLGVGGPRGSVIVPESYATYLLAGDETALPAIGRRLEEMAPGTQAIVLIEVEDEAEDRHLPTAANASVRWLHRNGAAAGRSTLLLDAVRQAPLVAGDTHAWIAAEIGTARAVRQHLVEERGLQRSDVRAAGYWRLGAPGAHERVEDD